jgi:hypothetical protein
LILYNSAILQHLLGLKTSKYKKENQRKLCLLVLLMKLRKSRL